MRVINEIGLELPSGPGRMAYHLTKGLAQMGLKSIVFTSNCSQTFDSDLVDVRIFKPSKRLGQYRLNPSMLSRLVKEEDVDLIHVHGYRNFESDAGAVCAFLTGRPLVVTCHGTVLAPLNEVWSLESRLLDFAYDGFTTRFTLRQADALVATTTREAEEIASFGMKKNKIRVIPNAIDLASVPNKNRNDDGLVRVLLVSRLTYKNNIEMAIQGFAKAVQKNERLRLKLVGDESASRFVGQQEKGYKERLLELCKNLGLDYPKVEFTGWLSGDALWNSYLTSDIFLWTSRYDNFAHALVEAANFSLPIVSTDVGVAREIVGYDSQGGLIVGQDNSDAVSEALVFLAGHPDIRKVMGNQNKKVSLKFSVQKMVESYLEIYENLTR